MSHCDCAAAEALRQENAQLKNELLDRNGYVLRLMRELTEALDEVVRLQNLHNDHCSMGCGLAAAKGE